MTKNRIEIILISRYVIMIVADILVIAGMSILSLLLLFNFNISGIPYPYLLAVKSEFAGFITISLVTFYLFRLYGSLWEFAGMHELMRVCAATILAVVLCWLLNLLTFQALPISYFVVLWLLSSVSIGFLRISYRLLRRILISIYGRTTSSGRVLLVGAGRMGSLMAKELENEHYKFGKAIAFIDDDPAKLHKQISGIKIIGNSEDIPRIVKKFNIDKIIFCIPSATMEQKKRILAIAIKTGCNLKVAQSIHGSLTRDVQLNTVRDVDVADLLSRPEVKLDSISCSYIVGQVILITGGGGSIGSELCRQVAKYNPKQIIIFEVSENSGVDIYNELYETWGNTIDIKLRIGSVRDIKRLEQVFNEFHPAVVFHAAAHKHVPLMEESPCEAVKNNVFGTLYTAKVASKANVSRFVLLSTDKAVNPTSVMGATKRITEMVIQAVNWHNTTIFTAVRFGNVLGSNGSVIPIFKKQIEKGGPVTVTHRDITRFFMTIPEAAQLVVQAGGLAKGGDVFILDMGEPVKIIDLALNLIRLSGFKPDVDIKIEITGLRPGEKLHEELSYEEEEKNREVTHNSKIFMTPPIEFDTKVFRNELDQLQEYAESGDADSAKQVIKDIIYNCVQHKTSGGKQLA